MAFWLANPNDTLSHGWVKRFDPVYWTLDFPRPMMASVTTIGPHALKVDLQFYRQNDLAGLIWSAEDSLDHPLLRYETARDFRQCQLKFRWQLAGVLPLDAVNGPTLTIEGRDVGGAPRSWFVRLWNYATGTPTNAVVSLDFGAINGGFLLPGEADPVWAGDVDRMFISLVPQGFTNSDAPLASPIEASVTISEIACDGSGSVLAIGDAMVPPHGFQIASGYDDAYNQTPARLLRNMLHLGYRGAINHYVGMSHYFRLEANGSGYFASLTGGALNPPCATWHADFAARAKAFGYGLIISLSFELFDAHCWSDWKQRAWNGDPAWTGYTPPSVLLSPAHAGAMNYLKAVARAFVQIAVAAGHTPRFQVGEPWWWVLPDGRICLYDPAAKAALGGSPVNIPDVRSTTLNAAQKALLDAAGAILAAATQAVVAAVRLDHPGCQSLILVYLPTVLDAAAPDLKRANVPIGWASPAFDVLQLEDYEWVTEGRTALSAEGVALMQTRLGYPVAQQHYLSGFVLVPEDRAQWARIDAAADAAAARGVSDVFMWASPQITRDGYTRFDEGDAPVQAFDDISFPIAIGREAMVSAGFSTAIVTTASGHEHRNTEWSNARMRYDAGPGVRSEDDLRSLMDFFRARRGAARAFRFRDPFDHGVAGQVIGSGNGNQTRFALVKTYGAGADAERRPITRPVAASVVVRLNGQVVTGWTLDGGAIQFATAPATGAVISADFTFDVPVRFAEDMLAIDSATFLAGEAASVPLIEVREG
jgi:uncharacterized protein (TIGR02217 family)